MTKDRDDAPEQEGAFVKALGTLDALFIGFGAMTGFGWSTLTGGWIDSACTVGALLAMICGSILMALVGLVYSELVAAMPQAGGEHNYLTARPGPPSLDDRLLGHRRGLRRRRALRGRLDPPPPRPTSSPGSSRSACGASRASTST